MIWGSGGSKSRLAKAAGAEPAGEMRDEKVHAVVARSTFGSQNVQNTPGPDPFGSWDVGKVHAVVARNTCPSQNVQNTPLSDLFWKLRCRKSARRCGAKHISEWRCTKHRMFAPLLEVQMSFRVAGAKDCAPCQKWAKREGFAAFPETMAGVGHLKRICKDAFRVAGAVQKTCSSEMFGGQGAHFLRVVAFWSIRSSGLLRWFCVTGAALRMTWLSMGGVEKSQNLLVRGCQRCTQPSIFEGSLAELFCFWCCQVQKSQNCFVLDVVRFKQLKRCRRMLSFQACR